MIPSKPSRFYRVFRTEYPGERKTRWSLIVLVVFLIGRLGSANLQDFIDNNILGITVGEDSLDRVTGNFGPGVVVEQGSAYCYSNKRTTEVVVFEIGEDRVVSVAIVTRADHPGPECKTRTLSAVRVETKRGVRLDDTRENVVAKYGAPHKETLRDGTTILEYHTDLEADSRAKGFYDLSLYFKGDRLVKLYVHNGS